MKASRILKSKKLLLRTTLYILLFVVSFVMVFPLAWTFITSIRADEDLFSYPPKIVVPRVSSKQYETLFWRTRFFTYMKNSLLVASGCTLISVFVSTLAAYSITRFRYRLKGALSQAILLTYLFPPVLIIVPLFVLFTSLGLQDSLVGLMLGHVTFACPFALWLLYAFFRGIPLDPEEAAMIDGASRLRAFWHTTFRLALPGIVTAALFAFVLSWNDYLFAFTLITSEVNYTLALAAVSFAATLSLDYGMLMALSVLINVPPLILIFFMRRRLLTGISFAGVKA